MTYLQLVNAVLRRLREPNAATLTESDYITMIGDFVNQAKREVEDAFDWLALESSVVIATSAGTAAYTLTGFGRRGKIRHVLNETNNGTIRAKDFHWIQRQIDLTDIANNQPSYWRLNGISGDDPILEFFPTPDAVYTINVYGIAPQDDLANDADSLTVPPWPVVLGAYAQALAERGDDRGSPFMLAQREYQSALADAIAIDNGNRFQGRYTDWVMV